MSLLQIIFSTIPILISLGAFFFSIKVHKRQKKIDEMTAIDKTKANIRAEVYLSETKATNIRVQNTGHADAENIRMIPENENEVKIRNLCDNIHPIKRLNSGQSCNLGVDFYSDNYQPMVTFVWDDKFGKDRKREQVLY